MVADKCLGGLLKTEGYLHESWRHHIERDSLCLYLQMCGESNGVSATHAQDKELGLACKNSTTLVGHRGCAGQRQQMSKGLSEAQRCEAQGSEDNNSISDTKDSMRERIETTRALIGEALIRRGALLRSIGTQMRRLRDLKDQATHLKNGATAENYADPIVKEGQQDARCTSYTNTEVQSSQQGVYGRVASKASQQSGIKDTRVRNQRRNGRMAKRHHDIQCCCSGFWGRSEDHKMQSISDFCCSVSISFRDVASCCSEAIDGSSAMVCHNSKDSSWFPKSLDLYLRTTACQCGCTVSSTCWFVHFPYQLPCESFLSFSATTNSPACTLSASIAIMASSIECMLLDGELQVLERSEVEHPMHGSMGSLPLRAALSDEHFLHEPEPCVQPDKDLTAWVKVRCGCAQSSPLGAACMSVVRQMLRTHACALSHADWRTACKKSIQWLQATVRNMRHASPDAVEALMERMHSVGMVSGSEHEGVDVDVDVARSGDSALTLEVLRWEDVPGATIVACEVMLCEMHAVLRESYTAVKVDQGLDASLLRARVMELVGSLGIMGRIAFQIAPRSLYATWASCQPGVALSTRAQLRAISRLGLSEEQTAIHADEWHMWVRQRNALTHSMTASLSKLESSVPGLSYLQKSFPMIQKLLNSDGIKSSIDSSSANALEASGAHAKQMVGAQELQIQSEDMHISACDTGCTIKSPQKRSVGMTHCGAGDGPSQSNESAPCDSLSAQDSEGARYIYVVRRAECGSSSKQERPVNAGQGLKRLSSIAEGSMNSTPSLAGQEPNLNASLSQKASRSSMYRPLIGAASGPGHVDPRGKQSAGSPLGAPHTAGVVQDHDRSPRDLGSAPKTCLEPSHCPKATASNDCEQGSTAEHHAAPPLTCLHAANADDADQLHEKGSGCGLQWLQPAAANSRVEVEEACGTSSGVIDCHAPADGYCGTAVPCASASDTAPVDRSVSPGITESFHEGIGPDASHAQHEACTADNHDPRSSEQHLERPRAQQIADTANTSRACNVAVCAGASSGVTSACDAAENGEIESKCMHDMHTDPQSHKGNSKAVYRAAEETSTVHNLFNAACLQMQALHVDPERSSDEAFAALAASAKNVERGARETGLLGESGDNVERASQAMHELQGMLHHDAVMFSATSTALFPHLTLMQQARVLGDPVQTGAPYIDQLLARKSSAHDQRWKELSMPFRIFE